MITGRDFIESQKLYSTGDDYLDELLEMAFCDGYEYYQKEFANQESRKVGHELGRVIAQKGGWTGGTMKPKFGDNVGIDHCALAAAKKIKSGKKTPYTADYIIGELRKEYPRKK